MKKKSRPENKFTQSLTSIIKKDALFFFFLLIIIFISYGILIPQLGFSGDDWTLIWSSYRLNAFHYISFRPIVLLFYRFLNSFLSPVPVQWFILANLFRWLGGIALYLFIRELIPEYRNEAKWFTVLFVLYPGCLIAYMPVTMIAPLAQPFFLYISFYLMIIWLRRKNKGWLFLFLSLFTATINLITTEYYFFLELLRPIIIWYVIYNNENRDSIWKTLKKWAVYLPIFIGAFLWRASTLQTSNPYRATLVSDFLSNPQNTILSVAKSALHDFYTVIIQPLIQAFIPGTNLGLRTQLIFFILMLVVGGLVFMFLFFQNRTRNENLTSKEPKPLLIIVFGIIAFILASLPFWIPEFQVVYGFDLRNRFTIPNALSCTLFIFAILVFVKNRHRLISIIIISILSGLFCGIQLRAANDFRKEWNYLEQFFWQFSWRVPRLEPGTIIIMNVPDLTTMADNAFSAALNWNYENKNHVDKIDYYVYFDEVQLKQDIPDFKNNLIIPTVHIIGNYEINTNQTIVINYDPTACLRILDPEIDIDNPDITDFTRKYISYSNDSVIQADDFSDSGKLDPSIFRNELPHSWCYDFEKADLARQLKDWNYFSLFGDKTFQLNEYPENVAELQPYIEGFAHIGNWEKALQLSKETIEISPESSQMTCALWQRIKNMTPESPNKEINISSISELAGCEFK